MLSLLKLGVNAAAVLIMLFLAYESTKLGGLAGWFPLSIALWGALLALLNLAVDLNRKRKTARDDPDASAAANNLETADFLEAGQWMLWIIAYSVTIWIGGIFVGTAVWLLAFFLIAGKLSKRFVAIATPAMLLMIYGYGEVMNLRWPDSLFF